MKSADLYMTFVIMLTDTIPDMARSGVSMRYFSPRYRKKDQKNVQSFREEGDNLARGVGMQINYTYSCSVHLDLGTQLVSARHRLSVTIIRGRVMVVMAAAARERGRGNGEAPEEISAHSLQAKRPLAATLVLRPLE